jgi:aminopeptidase N
MSIEQKHSSGSSKYRKIALLIGVLLLSCSIAIPLVTADTYPRQPGVDALHYVFRLTLGDDADEIVGEATVDLRFLKEGLTEFALDLASAADGKGMTVSDVTSNGSAIRFSHQADRLVIPLAPPPGAGEQRQFTVRYRGVPASGLRIGKNKYGDRTFFSLNWPNLARQWLPMIDHPYDKATSEFIVTAPARYQVVANGSLQEERDLGDGRRLTHWKQSEPISSWLNAIGVAQFASRHLGVAKGVPIQTWVYPQDREVGGAAFDTNSRLAVEFFSEYVGPYPYEKLGNVQAAGLGGGTEHASAIFYGETSIDRGAVASLVAHETAHQWFGDAVTESDWDDVWLSEGFATYFTLLYIEHYYGRDEFVIGLNRSRSTVFDLEKKNPGLAVIHDNLSDMKRVLNGLVYQKGGWALHMLRGLIGDEKFRTGVREYYRRYRDGNASTDDFRRVMESNSGADLSWFFQQWLKRAGSPVVEGGWRYDPASKRLVVELAQTQPGDVYRLPLELGLTVEGAPRTRVEKIEMTQRRQRFEVAADKEPSSVKLDPNTWILMDARFGKS